MVSTDNISKTAAKQFKKLDKTAQKRILTFLHEKVENAANPRAQGKALRGKHGELWRYRIGDYRVICNIDDDTITLLVLAIGHRKTVYKKSIT